MEQLQRLQEIVARLRAPGGCPWDREQDHQSLRPFMLEEAYEALDALDSGDMQHFKEELGDLMLQIFLHGQIAAEKGQFTLADIAESIADKLIRRHPHVFADVVVANSQEVLDNWEKIKKKERGGELGEQNPFSSLTKGLSALIKSQKIGKKTEGLGFDWPQIDAVRHKVAEELRELQQALGNKQKMTEEFGDLLFSLCQWSRHAGIDAEDALAQSNAKFVRRFKVMISLFNQQTGQNLSDFVALPADRKEEYWQKAKKHDV